ncbi:ribosomal protein S5 domain 2-type protein [Emericellopsis atlantica]|uniref:Ribosomal protein S5 domain 2-type protein n=1 Tax=Emericellopsis atlantica TaxID=2614577 RepID=A0A9P7ZFQ5_9HYPO|nr:ribosomal protein S5 domain 2-type protein [Emericellopsis atlantica]KAG9250881.1 ribosomal protein S5 domain 2-type protein [Emericellopsis atlantica]
MSEELLDEVEAINSIYGDATLAPASDTASDDASSIYILKLPNEASSLRVAFPKIYPHVPPEVLGTHHASGGKKGAGARDLGLFVDALSEVYEPGIVCIFDAVEAFNRRVEEEEQDGEEEEEGEDREVTPEPRTRAEQEEMDIANLPTPPWTVTDLTVEMKSTFVAHVAPVSSPAQARQYLTHLLSSSKQIRTATHNISAWRIRDPNSGTSWQDCDDDGETAAGGRVLRLMQMMDVWGVMVVVTRWYGGVKMGPRRFAVINGVAREGIVKAGYVEEKGKDGKKKGK